MNETAYPYFLTDIAVAWLPVFSHPQQAGIIFDSWRFLQRERGVRLFGYAIMENHLHWIAAAEDFDERDINYNFDYNCGAYQAVERNFGRMVKAGHLEEAMELALERMRSGSHQVEMSDEGMMTAAGWGKRNRRWLWSRSTRFMSWKAGREPRCSCPRSNWSHIYQSLRSSTRREPSRRRPATISAQDARARFDACS